MADTSPLDPPLVDDRPAPRKNKPVRRRILIAALVLVGLIAVVIGLAGNPASRTGTAVETVAASTGDVSLSVSASGVIVDEYTYSLSAGQSATLTAKGGTTVATAQGSAGYKTTKLYVGEGDEVDKGDKIARVKDSLGDYHTVSTPAAGHVRSLTTAVGASASQVATIGAGKLLVSVPVSEYDISGVVEGLDVDLTLGATKATFSGTVYSVGELADNSTGVQTYTVLIESEALPADARNGMSVTASINVQSVTGVVTVPVSAITGTGDSATVSIVGDRGLVTVVPVKLGLVGDTIAEITSGVSAGDLVVVGNSGSVPVVSTGGFGPGGN
jgi:multidrug efflux pump subunit AcrA (membrane-fusion protein)